MVLWTVSELSHHSHTSVAASTPVSMGLHSIRMISRDGLHVLTEAAAKIFCQGVSSTRVFFRGHDLMAKEV